MTIQARLLLLAKDQQWPERLGAELDRLGWRTITAYRDDAALACIGDLQIEAVLIDGAHPACSLDLVEKLRAACAPRRLPIIQMTDPGTYNVPTGWDMVYSRDAHAQQILLGLEHMVRANVAEEEYELRRETLASLNIPAPDIDDRAPLAILSVGQADPDFLGLSHTLRTHGTDVYAAFTSYSAFDYLHDKTFDAVILWGRDSISEPLSIASGMRRNTRLYHTPVFLRLQKPVDLDLGDAFLRGVNDVSAVGASEAEIADRVMRLARAHRRQTNIRKALEALNHSEHMDKGTGLFTRDLFAAHLARLSNAASERNRPLSVCVLKISESPEITQARARKALDRAMPQIGSMISRLVRAEDTAGRLSTEVFALALPATAEGAARIVGERISAVIGCTAFEAGSGKSPFVVEFDVGVAEMLENEPVSAALTRAAEQIRPSYGQAV
ncbi:diguanylate cyclase domain-containing protein [Asticcacaulis sp. YBE204]|uniref:diguanylate cyclase domain-containing protein n=1 Tax=Asticcacaulis sp. YBE204 TaxID=1282363 RepID=UPI0003C3F454|nr:diguanylate cyclase [Asticcacaulis sp. YBE204]ESQ77063.1 diguanylate cyclase [Asticcacaulis sp. YBE204]